MSMDRIKIYWPSLFPCSSFLTFCKNPVPKIEALKPLLITRVLFKMPDDQIVQFDH